MKNRWLGSWIGSLVIVVVAAMVSLAAYALHVGHWYTPFALAAGVAVVQFLRKKDETAFNALYMFLLLISVLGINSFLGDYWYIPALIGTIWYTLDF